MAIELVDTAGEVWKSVTAFPEMFHSTKEILMATSKSKIHPFLPSQTQVLKNPGGGLANTRLAYTKFTKR